MSANNKPISAIFESEKASILANQLLAKVVLNSGEIKTSVCTVYFEGNKKEVEEKTYLCNKVYVSKVDNLKVIVGSTFLIANDKLILDDSYDKDLFITREEATSNCLIKDSFFAFRGLVEHLKVDTLILNLSGVQDKNTFRWFVECLSQLVILRNEIDLNDIRIIIANNSPAFFYETLFLIGISDDQIIKAASLTVYDSKNSIWISPVTSAGQYLRKNLIDFKFSKSQIDFPYAPNHPEALKQVTDYFKDLSRKNQASFSYKKVYCRQNLDIRFNSNCLANETEVSDLLNINDFKSVYLNSYDLLSQISILNNAEVVVSPLTEAYFSLLWMKHGSSLYVLLNDFDNSNFDYLIFLASVFEVKVHFIVGKSINNNLWSAQAYSDYVISLKKITEVLALKNTQINKRNIKKFAFIVHAPSMLNHYQNVWKELGRDKFDIIFAERFINDHNGNRKNGFSNFMKVVVENDYKIVTARELLANNFKYEYAISNHIISGKHIEFDNKNPNMTYMPLLVAKKQIRFMYGADINEGWSLNDWNKIYDVILCHGVNDESEIKKRFDAKTYIMGYPRYDEFFDKSLCTKEIYKEFNLDPNKKTIVWMPTLGGDYSSIPIYAQVLSKLNQKFNFIIRPHPMTFDDEPDYVSLLKKHQYKIDDKATRNLNELYAIADLVLADNGGVPFSCVFLGKNFVFLEVDDNLGKDAKGSFYIVDSSVSDLKKSITTLNLENCDEIELLIQSEDFYIQNNLAIDSLFQRFFNSPRGGGAQRVADILNSLE